LADDLHQRGVSYFLPMTGDRVSSGGRLVPVMRPLFPGYLFCYADDLTFTERVKHDEPRKRVWEIIELHQGAQSTLHHQLSTIRAVKRFYKPVDVTQYKPGCTCEILAPEALKGVRTTIMGVRASEGTYLVQVPVQMLGASVFEIPIQNLHLLRS
jgi:hypothetical protein